MNLEAIMQLLKEEEQLRPVIKAVFKALQNYGPELRELVNNMVMAVTEMRVAQIELLESKNFTREEAMLITMNEWYGIRRGLLQNKK